MWNRFDVTKDKWFGLFLAVWIWDAKPKDYPFLQFTYFINRPNEFLILFFGVPSCLSAAVCLSRLTDGTLCPVCQTQTGQAYWPFSLSRHVLGRPIKTTKSQQYTSSVFPFAKTRSVMWRQLTKRTSQRNDLKSTSSCMQPRHGLWTAARHGHTKSLQDVVSLYITLSIYRLLTL